MCWLCLHVSGITELLILAKTVKDLLTFFGHNTGWTHAVHICTVCTVLQTAAYLHIWSCFGPPVESSLVFILCFVVIQILKETTCS